MWTTLMEYKTPVTIIRIHERGSDERKGEFEYAVVSDLIPNFWITALETSELAAEWCERYGLPYKIHNDGG